MKNLFNYLKFLSFGAVVVSLVFFSSCKEDEPEVNPLVGTYVLSQAYFTGQVTEGGETENRDPIVFLNFPDGTGGVSDVEVPAGIGGAAFATSVLAGAITDVDDPSFTCDAANTRIDLRDGGKFYIICNSGGSEVEQGTWADLGNNTLQLFLTDLGTQVLIEDYALNGNTLTGTISNLPLPEDFAEPALPCCNLLLLETLVTFQKD
jgi:hypothetical protein